MRLKHLLPYIVIAVCLIIMSTTLIYKCNSSNEVLNLDNNELEIKEPEFMFGICIDSLNVVTAEVKRGETFGALLEKYGVPSTTVHDVVLKSKGVFDLRTFREGNLYNVLTSMDSTQNLKYFIYEHSAKEFILIDFTKDVEVKKIEKEVVVERRYGEAIITSSLWEAAVSAGMNGTLAMNLSDVFQWTIDFYAIQKGDSFKVIYDELFIEGKSIGIGTIWGACLTHNNKDYYGIRYEYSDGGIKDKGYWDETGKSLKSAFLKAPLKYSRISSKFSNSRMHPVLRIRRPHHGVDYAAPSGTPVQSISNGVVIARGYAGGGGNTVKIRHSRGYVSGYLHLKGYASGIKTGASVTQGQIIGYVGSTGTSTGPHLDFRIWKNGKAIDPLKMTGEKGEDITKSQKNSYNIIKDKVLSELKSGVTISEDPVLKLRDSTKINLFTVPLK